ncbi:unnamed protein product [Cylicocyclus nassatus]|uniref:Uncharacterized protein n=1 Tax=Cylicocyclus nassatus TaxID=53992 RepID=A0AA36MC65_CYLNA|nr:unnamed protein product [Cylicocyclus nassatus]
MQQELLDCITFPYDDATRRKLLILYKQKESLFDGEILQEHLLSQPLLGVFLLLFAIFSLGSFVFAIIFIACRALGNCGAKRYQTHPTKGKRYVLFLVMVIISWVGLAGATVHFLTSAIALWNPPLDVDTNEVPDLHHQSGGHAALQRDRRDTDDMTVRQLFEDSDYVGDFEQIDATTAAAFVTEKLQPNSSTLSDLKQKKKLVDLKGAKRIRYFYGQHTKPSTAATSSTSSSPKYFAIKTKSNTEIKSKNPSTVSPQYGRQPHAGFMTRGIASVKAIRQPFVSDTWSNAGKQAYYRHHLSPTTNSSSSSLTAIVLDNSVTRTEQPDLVLSNPKEAAEVESLLHNFIANDSVEPAEKASTTTLVSTTTTEVTEPSTSVVTTMETTMGTSLSSEITSTEEATATPITSTTESENGHTTTIETAETEKEAETSTQPSESSEETDATTSIEISGEVSDFSEETQTPALGSEELFYTSDNPFVSLTSEGTTEAGTTSPTASVQTTASTTTSADTTVQTTTSKSTTLTTTTTTELPTESTTFTTLIKTTLPPATMPSTTTETEAATVRTTTAKTFRAPSRSDNVEKKHKTIYVEEDKLVALKVPPTLRVMQLNSTAALLRQQDPSEVPKIQRKSRFETRSTFPAEKLTVMSKQNTTSAVMPVFQEQTSWAARFFVLFIGIVMVLLTIPTPILVTAGTVCYMRSYHPMDRTAFSEKVGQLCVVLATVFLFFTPCLYFYLDVLLAYIHVYFAMCPSIRLLHQYKSLSLEELSMLDAKLSGSSNVQACRRSSEAYEGIWSACFAFVLFSIPTLLALFKLSKYYLRMKTEYYWNVGDGYGIIRPKVATTTDAVYGNIYGTVQRKRPGTKPPPRPVQRSPVADRATYGVYIETPTYGVFKLLELMHIEKTLPTTDKTMMEPSSFMKYVKDADTKLGLCKPQQVQRPGRVQGEVLDWRR